MVAEAGALDAPVVSTSPWFYRRRDGWVFPSAIARRAGRDARQITPEALHAWAQKKGMGYAAIETGRVTRTYPGLVPLFEDEAPPGFERLAKVPGWQVFRIVDVE